LGLRGGNLGVVRRSDKPGYDNRGKQSQDYDHHHQFDQREPRLGFPNRRTPADIRFVFRIHGTSPHQIPELISKMGKSMENTRKPTTTPMTTIIRGSSKLTMPFTVI